MPLFHYIHKTYSALSSIAHARRSARANPDIRARPRYETVMELAALLCTTVVAKEPRPDVELPEASAILAPPVCETWACTALAIRVAPGTLFEPVPISVTLVSVALKFV